MERQREIEREEDSTTLLNVTLMIRDLWKNHRAQTIMKLFQVMLKLKFSVETLSPHGIPKETLGFVSELYPGSKSDKEIVSESGILKRLVPGDLIL